MCVVLSYILYYFYFLSLFQSVEILICDYYAGRGSRWSAVRVEGEGKFPFMASTWRMRVRERVRLARALARVLLRNVVVACSSHRTNFL